MTEVSFGLKTNVSVKSKRNKKGLLWGKTGGHKERE